MSAATPTEALRQKVVTGLAWSVVRNWGNRFITLGVFVLLARLLEPAQMGLFAAAVAVLAIVDIFIEQGFGDAIVQRRTLSTAQVNAAFYVTLMLASLAYAALFAAAPMIERRMHTEGLATLLRWAGVAMLINAFGSCQQAMLRREFDYKWLALRVLMATGVAGAVAATCAVMGLGVWSLVVQYLVFSVLNVGLMWLRPRWRPTREVDAAGLRELLRYGSSVLGTRLLEYGNVRFIELFLAATLGPVALGIYMVGARIHQTLMLLLISSFMDVSLSAFARLADRMDEFRRAYYRATEATGALVMPCFVVTALLAPELTVLAFGQKWADSAFVLRVLGAVGALQVVQYLNHAAISARGRPDIALALNGLKAAMAVVALLVSRGEDLHGVVLAFAIGQVLATLGSLYLGGRVLEAPLAEVARRLAPSATACLAMVAVVSALRLVDDVAQLPLALRTALLLTAAALSYLGCWRLLAPDQMRAVFALVGAPRAGRFLVRRR
jgi:O-antigen/teichoic acid export membrane protein